MARLTGESAIMIRSLLQKLRVPGFRNPRPMVAVLRLTGVIGQSGSALRPGLTIAGLVENFERAFCGQEPQGCGVVGELPWRRTGAVLFDPKTNPRPGRGKRDTGICLRRGCRGLRRILAGLLCRRDLCRRDVGDRIAGSHLGRVRISRAAAAVWRRTPGTRLGRKQEHARPVPTRRPGRCRAVAQSAGRCP